MDIKQGSRISFLLSGKTKIGTARKVNAKTVVAELSRIGGNIFVKRHIVKHLVQALALFLCLLVSACAAHVGAVDVGFALFKSTALTETTSRNGGSIHVEGEISTDLARVLESAPTEFWQLLIQALKIINPALDLNLNLQSGAPIVPQSFIVPENGQASLMRIVASNPELLKHFSETDQRKIVLNAMLGIGAGEIR